MKYFLAVPLYELPVEYDGMQFTFADGRNVGTFEIDTHGCLSLMAVERGCVVFRNVEGGQAAALRNNAWVVVEIKASIYDGISIGGKLIVTAEDLAADEGGPWLDMSGWEWYNIAREYMP